MGMNSKAPARPTPGVGGMFGGMAQRIPPTQPAPTNMSMPNPSVAGSGMPAPVSSFGGPRPSPQQLPAGATGAAPSPLPAGVAQHMPKATPRDAISTGLRRYGR